MAGPNAREKIVEAGLKVLIEKGFNGSGVQDIAAAVGVPKGSFYNLSWSTDIAAVIAEAQSDGSITTKTPAVDLSAFLLDANEGALLRARVEKSGRAFDRFMKVQAATLLRRVPTATDRRRPFLVSSVLETSEPRSASSAPHRRRKVRGLTKTERNVNQFTDIRHRWM
jgi:DNA-binding transcriptional regulator YbjK